MQKGSRGEEGKMMEGRELESGGKDGGRVERVEEVKDKG